MIPLGMNSREPKNVEYLYDFLRRNDFLSSHASPESPDVFDFCAELRGFYDYYGETTS
jgi:hypothetical protein